MYVCMYVYIYLIKILFLNSITGVLRSVPKRCLEYLSQHKLEKFMTGRSQPAILVFTKDED